MPEDGHDRLDPGSTLGALGADGVSEAVRGDGRLACGGDQPGLAAGGLQAVLVQVPAAEWLPAVDEDQPDSLTGPSVVPCGSVGGLWVQRDHAFGVGLADWQPQPRVAVGIAVQAVDGEAGDLAPAGSAPPQQQQRRPLEGVLEGLDGSHQSVQLVARERERAAERGEVEELRARADVGNESAVKRLADLLAERGEVEELRARADAGDEYAVVQLAGVLAERGEVQELRALADAGSDSAAFRLDDLLAERGEVEELQARADAGSDSAAFRLADLLVERGEVEELQARANAGSDAAAFRLTDELAKRGDLDVAIAAARDWVRRGSSRTAGERLVELSARNGDDATAEQIRRFGLNPDGSVNDGSPNATAPPTGGV